MNFKIDDPHFLPHTGCQLEFSILPGTCLVFAGENGVGKTTLGRRIYTECSEMHPVHIEQVSLDHFYDRSLRMFKKIFLNSKIEIINKSIFEELWLLFGLNSKEERLLSTLSGGENQALKIVLGLCGYHNLIIMDEPSHFLDEARKKSLKVTIEKMLSSGKTMVLIEHDLTWLPAGLKVIELVNKNEFITKGREWTT